MEDTPRIPEELLYVLEQSHESLSFALQSARMSTWDIDLKNDSVNCSLGMLKLWGVDPQTFTGKRSELQSKVHPEDLEKMKAAINLAIQNNGVYELEYRILPTPGEVRWVQSRGRCTYGKNSLTPIRFSGVVFDITEKREREAAVEAANRAREQFLSVAGHELRTPLTCLQLQLQVLESELLEKYPKIFEDEYVLSGIKKQKEHLYRLSRIVDNVFEQAKLRDGSLKLQKEKFDLALMTEVVVQKFRASVQVTGGGDISFCKKCDHLWGHWDRSHMEQALMHLLSNAVRFGNRKPITVEVDKDDEMAYIYVRDQGVGVRKEDQLKIFERFAHASVKNDMSGIGLGLFLTKAIVSSHGGKVGLISEAGKGAEFSLVLPRLA